MSELFTIHPPIPECPEQSGWGFARDDWFDDRASERKLTEKKRLTEAELAAEYHKQGHVFMLNGGSKAPDMLHQSRIWDTLYRFATLPNYDEAPTHPTRTGTL